VIVHGLSLNVIRIIDCSPSVFDAVVLPSSRHLSDLLCKRITSVTVLNLFLSGLWSNLP